MVCFRKLIYIGGIFTKLGSQVSQRETSLWSKWPSGIKIAFLNTTSSADGSIECLAFSLSV